jgi:dipeptidase E
MRLLLISNSTNTGEEYLGHPRVQIREFLGETKLECLFIPYAGVTVSFNNYANLVRNRFREIGHDIISIHIFPDPVVAVKQASAIVVGGGNTFRLLSMLYENKLLEAIRERVMAGIPYIGWSAGANLACPTIMTTNDMPITEPHSFSALNQIPFQINPHYLDAHPEGHAGETRAMRIEEFITLHPQIYVAGLREGTMFRIENKKINLQGPRSVRIFRKNMEPLELSAQDDLSILMENE